MFSFRMKKAYMALMLCSAIVTVLVFGSGLSKLVALANTQPRIFYLTSRIQVPEHLRSETRLALTNSSQSFSQLLENQPENISPNSPKIAINGQQLAKFLRMTFQFLKVCSKVNPQCIPSFFNWIWNFMTNPFTWIIGGIFFIAIVKTSSDEEKTK